MNTLFGKLLRSRESNHRLLAEARKLIRKRKLTRLTQAQAMRSIERYLCSHYHISKARAERIAFDATDTVE